MNRVTVFTFFCIVIFTFLFAACVKNETVEVADESAENAAAGDAITLSPVAVVSDQLALEIEEEEEPAPADPIEECINTCLSELSVAEKIGQMFICAFRDNELGVTEINGAMKDALSAFHVGGAVLFNENMRDKPQTQKLIADLQSASNIPLFIAVDEEGGVVSRLVALGYERLPRASRIGSSGDISLAFAQGAKIAANLKELGFNLNFAPVADLSTNKQNTVIGSRAFSDDPQIAGAMVREFVRGLQSEGMIATLKHFPGHGDSKEDSHYSVATVTHDLERLNEKELVPFNMGIEAGAGLVMVGHISAPNITGTDEAAVFSAQIVTAILREQLGFAGVIITDAMDMGAVVKYAGPAEAAVKAVLAGVDVLLMPQDLGLAFAGLLKAVENGEISESRIDESVKRILRMKARFGIIVQ